MLYKCGMVYGRWECYKYWSFKNPHSIFGVPLHDCIVGVLCAVSARIIVGLLFFKEKINSYRYCMFNLTQFFRELRTKMYGSSYRKKITVHAANLSKAALADISVEPLIYCGLCPWSPDSESVCYLWQTLTNRVYVFITNSVHETKYHIRGRMVNIPEKSCFFCRRLYFQKLRCWISAYQDSSLKVR